MVQLKFKHFFKYIAVILSIVLSINSIIFSMSVKSHTEGVLDGAIWIYNNFADTVSSIAGAVFEATDACWEAWKKYLGFENDDEGFQIFNNGHINIGEGGEVQIDPDYYNDLQNFVEDYQEEIGEDTGYLYSIDFNQLSNWFANRSIYEQFRQVIRQNQGKIVTVAHINRGTYADPSLQNLGLLCPRVYVFETGSCFVGGSNLTWQNQPMKKNSAVYDNNWVQINPSVNMTEQNMSAISMYCISHTGDTSLTKYTFSDQNSAINDVAILNCYISESSFSYSNPNTENGSDYSSGFVSVSGPVGIPWFKNTDVMRSYSLNEYPYYVVPTNDIWTYDGGYYVSTTSKVDSSISYGDITSYIDSNNVTDYNVVYNYINNYYSNGSGGSGGSGGSDDSGSDIDWGWLGKIGEVIGGLISALGNVIAGIIDGISDLITSLTENLPNIFGGVINWLLPFLPNEITSLLSLLFLAVIIVGVVRLIRGK